jgi:predicted lipoprotein with Yx(FWY)xxD motif
MAVSCVEKGMTKPLRTERAGLLLRIAGAALLAAAGAVHLDLYLTGYRSIPTIGWLFLLQTITAFGLAVLVAVWRNWLVSAVGALFALATFCGYLLSVWVGLFGFKEVRTTAGIAAGIIEVAAFATLAFASRGSVPQTGSPSRAGNMLDELASRMQAAARVPGAAVISVAVAALVLLGVAAATAGTSAQAAAGGSLRTATVGGVLVLTNSRGFTLYWFAPDTPADSKCYGSCAAYWPPVKGPASAAAGIPGTFGTIRRSDGSAQATYNGHPLYTYIGDSGPDEAHGNNITLNGGLWHEVTVSR